MNEGRENRFLFPLCVQNKEALMPFDELFIALHAENGSCLHLDHSSKKKLCHAHKDFLDGTCWIILGTAS